MAQATTGDFDLEGGYLECEAPRILVVDDVETNRGLLKRLVSRRGFEVIEAESGVAALDLVAVNPPDLILLDIDMPDMSGVETLRELRRRHDAGSLPIIMVTANHEGRVTAECLAAGANDYVTKPVQWNVLRARMNTHLGLRQAHMQLLKDRERLEAVCVDRAVLAFKEGRRD